jgi:ligand-binding sensor protein
MAKRDFDLSTLLDVPLWETVQDQLAEMTGTAIITIDFKGNPITKHSCRTEFCSVIRENPVFRKRCFRCDALAGLEAVRLERPYIYLCHCGIVDVAVPVMVGDRYLGAVMFGQVRLPGNDSDAKVERLVNEISTFQAESENARLDLLEKYERLPEMEYDRIVQAANLIQSMVNYIQVEHKPKVDFHYLMPGHSKYTTECRCVRKSIGILPNGDVVACFWALDSATGAIDPKFLLGNVKESSLLEILNSEKARYWSDCSHGCELSVDEDKDGGNGDDVLSA